MLQHILDYFQTLEKHPVQRMIILVAGMLLLWLLEGAIPLITMQYKKSKWRHASINFSFTVIHLIIHTGFAVIIVLISDACKRNGFGIVNWLHASVFWTIIISFIVLDFFGGWLVHMVQHKTYFLWRFHIIHHSDNNVDVTTGLRHHPDGKCSKRNIFFNRNILIRSPGLCSYDLSNTAYLINSIYPC